MTCWALIISFGQYCLQSNRLILFTVPAVFTLRVITPQLHSSWVSLLVEQLSDKLTDRKLSAQACMAEWFRTP